MPMQTLLLIAFALFSGLLMTRLFDRFHLPDVTAYLVTGVLVYELVGPSLTKWALTRAGDIRRMPDEVASRRTKEVREAAKPVPAAFRK